MSGIRGNNTGFGSLIKLLKRVMAAAAVVCLLALAFEGVLDRPAETVLAEAEATPTPTAEATPLPSAVPSTPSPSPTARPTSVATEIAPSPTPDDVEPPSSEETLSFHVVQEGETLTEIARTYGVPVGGLILVNELANPDVIYVGQRLELPGSAGVPSTPEPGPTGQPAEPTPMASLSPGEESVEGRWIDVDISEQRLTAYEDDVPVRTTLVSTGLPRTPTPLGQFRIWIKLRYDDMAGADYYIEDVPYVMYFYQGYGLHGVTWHGNFGHPMSHGCVNLPTSEAGWLFEWAEVGTLVNVHE